MSLAGAHKIHRAWNTPQASQALLVRNPGAPILHIDDTAFPKSVLLQEVPHGCIVPVGIDADVGNPGQAVGQAFPENPLPGMPLRKIKPNYTWIPLTARMEIRSARIA